MLQMINISEARNNLAKVVKNIKESGKSVIIIQDSKPVVMISPYTEDTDGKEEYLKKLLAIKGGWFSQKEYKKNRKDLNKRFSRLKW